MADKFRGHHIVCTSLYEGKGYSGAFCENMTAVVERLRKIRTRTFSGGGTGYDLCELSEPDGDERVRPQPQPCREQRPPGHRILRTRGEQGLYIPRDVQTRTRGDEHGISLWRTVENATGASRDSASTKICSHSSTAVSRKNRR